MRLTGFRAIRRHDLPISMFRAALFLSITLAACLESGSTEAIGGLGQSCRDRGAFTVLGAAASAAVFAARTAVLISAKFHVQKYSPPSEAIDDDGEHA